MLTTQQKDNLETLRQKASSIAEKLSELNLTKEDLKEGGAYDLAKLILKCKL